MRKIIALTCFITLLILLAGCNHDVSYAERVNAEKDRISEFIDQQNVEVLNTYPSNGVFGENQYYKDNDSGVYFHVVDSGNGKRAAYRSEVYFRFSEVTTLPIADSESLDLWGSNPGLQPLSFIYGVTSTYTDSYSSGPSNYYLSQGVTIPLQYVGENAIVDMIVPFKSGSANQSSYFSTLFYKRLRYTTIINGE